MTIDLSFPHNDNRYMCERCCCGTVHCLTGTRRIAIIAGAWSCINLLAIIFSGYFTFSLLAVALIDITTAAFLFLGIRQMNPRFILPYVIWSFINMIAKALSLFIALIVSIFFTTVLEALILAITEGKKCSETSEEMAQKAFIFFLLVISFLLILNYWFYNVTKRCYTYLKDFEEHRKIHGSVEVEGSALP